MISNESQQKLENLYKNLLEKRPGLIGYPCNDRFDYSPLYKFLEMSINNVGDPYSKSSYKLNTAEIEREVIDYFAKLVKAPQDNFWGYCTNGGTEGNMYGLFLARELYPEATFYYSQDTHYSVQKLLKLLNVRSIMIRTQNDGRIDLEDLEETLRLNRQSVPVIVCNIGTTMKGAIDDLSSVKKILNKLAFPNHYIHCDCALSGMILPFVENPQAFNFADGCDSLSISGHKFIGSPLPCGIVVAKKTNVDLIARSIEYVGALDTTITGSRNAFTPLVLWYAIESQKDGGFKELVEGCIDVARYALDKMNSKGIKAWMHENSITVVFAKPPQDVIKKWSLAVESGICHLITVPHVTKEIVDMFVDELAESLKRQG